MAAQHLVMEQHLARMLPLPGLRQSCSDGTEGAANILYRKEIEAAADPAKATVPKTARNSGKQFLSPYVSASAGYIDDVIEPKENLPRELSPQSFSPPCSMGRLQEAA